MPRGSSPSSDAARLVSFTVTRLLVPLKESAFPYFPAVTHVAPEIVPVFPRPDASTTAEPAPSSKPYAATSPPAATFATVAATAADVVWLPAASRARAVSVCEPLAVAVVFQLTEYGAVVSSAPSATPSSRNCTPATPTLSDAVAETVTVPDTVLPAAGAVTDAVGAVVSPLLHGDRRPPPTSSGCRPRREPGPSACASRWPWLSCSRRPSTARSCPPRRSATPSSRNCTPTTPTLSDAVAETVTVPETVLPAAGAVTDTVGAVVSPFCTVTDTAADVVWLPAASRARAVSVCEPLAVAVVFQLTEYGAVASSAPSATPSSRNCTPATPTLSDAVAETVTVPETVLPAAGRRHRRRRCRRVAVLHGDRHRRRRRLVAGRVTSAGTSACASRWPWPSCSS